MSIIVGLVNCFGLSRRILKHHCSHHRVVQEEMAGVTKATPTAASALVDSAAASDIGHAPGQEACTVVERLRAVLLADDLQQEQVEAAQQQTEEHPGARRHSMHAPLVMRGLPW
eukprot:scpid56134/ scgid24208/ 